MYCTVPLPFVLRLWFVFGIYVFQRQILDFCNISTTLIKKAWRFVYLDDITEKYSSSPVILWKLHKAFEIHLDSFFSDEEFLDIGEKGWRSCESACLPPMWPGYSSFPLSPKNNIWIDLSWFDLQLDCWTPVDTAVCQLTGLSRINKSLFCLLLLLYCLKYDFHSDFIHLCSERGTYQSWLFQDFFVQLHYLHRSHMHLKSISKSSCT